MVKMSKAIGKYKTYTGKKKFQKLLARYEIAVKMFKTVNLVFIQGDYF